MKIHALLTLLRRDVGRSSGPLGTAGFGIAAGTGALIYFLALSLGVRAVLLGDVFPLDRVELEPRAGAEPGLLSLLLNGQASPPSIAEASVERMGHVPGVVHVFPKLRFAFPAGAFGGKEIVGREIGTHEILADGVEPTLVTEDVKGAIKFEDPLAQKGLVCQADNDCEANKYCEKPSSQPSGQCSAPVPVLVSHYLVELFNKGIAPAHGFPSVGASLLSRAEGLPFTINLGVSMLGKARQGVPRTARARIVGVSRHAIDLGLTLPLGVVRRWNQEYTGVDAAERYSSLVVKVRHAGDVAAVVSVGSQEGLEARETRARDMSILVTGITALLSLVAGVMLTVAASNIAYTFRVLLNERRTEIGLYRALGATTRDIRLWLTSLAMVVGLSASSLGVLLAIAFAIATNWFAAHSLPDFPFKPESFFRFPAWLLALGVAFGALCSLFGAIFAIRRATSLDPSQALLEKELRLSLVAHWSQFFTDHGRPIYW